MAPPSRNRRRARALAPALAGALVLPLIGAGPAFADLLTPESGGSPNADQIDSLYKLILAIAIVVFVGVEATLIYSLVKFRARRGAVAAQIRGNTRLEVGWTVGAALILVVLSVFTFLKLPSIRNPPNSGPNGLELANGVLVAAGPEKRLPPDGRALNICVLAMQYTWRYAYADDCEQAPLTAPFAYEAMYVPTDTTVTLELRSVDVVHSWWIPKLGGKQDAVPGYVNHTWFKIPGDRAGEVFTGQCAEFCGRNHANMTARVNAVTPAQFEQWLARQRRAIRAANLGAQQQRGRVAAGQEP